LIFNSLRKKLWFKLFIRIAAIFIVFVTIIAISNVSFLLKFFVMKEKNALCEQIKIVSELDLRNTNKILDTITEISEKHNFDVEIYNTHGKILYTTHGGQIMDFYRQNDDRFNMSHEDVIVNSSENLGDGIIFQSVSRRFDNNEMLVCKKKIADNVFAEIRVSKELVANSATIANEFIIIISVICLLASVTWVLIFARKFSKPICEMNQITKNMAGLDFKQKIEDSSDDEIGQLAHSINNLSDSLSFALEDLKEKNRKLENDIEAERKLDSMRKAFIANVSHELKTPISIINGYAEGLKLDINPSAREEYCNTIIDEGERMNRLVLSIMELSKYESGQMPIKKENFDIGIVIEKLSRNIFKNTNLTLENKVKEKTFVYADRLQIEQVITALLENAAVYTPENGVVTITAEEKDIIRISVFNTGSFVDEEKMPELWQSFYRGDTSHKRDSSHFGLGLSIVSAIMKMHGTNCGVYNTEAGVCFWFEVLKAEDGGI